MLRYAREDTHYLLYVYDVMRNQLINGGNEMKNLLRSVYSKSKIICGSVRIIISGVLFLLLLKFYLFVKDPCFSTIPSILK